MRLYSHPGNDLTAARIYQTRGAKLSGGIRQYSSASMIVMTRWVTDGSAGSGECIDML